jgi:hypothetical protein
METMILVAGLAVAGLAGIAAAFYYSMRPGGSEDHTDRTGRAEVDRVPAGRSRTSRLSPGRPDRSAEPARSARSARPTGSGSRRAVDRTGPSTVIDFTGPQRVLDDEEPLVTGHRARHGGRRDDTPNEPEPARRAAGRRSREAEPDDADAAPRSRRRVGWRKGSDVDEELWPVEAFGGVSDEQFWDDLASDKPLATTARAAQPEAAAKRRPPQGGPLPDLHPAHDRGRGDGRRGAGDGPGTHPQPRLGPDDRTAIQAALQSPSAAPGATQPYPTVTQPSPTTTQPVRAAHQAAEARGRSRAGLSAGEDPLTSPAYSLRPKGRVDGRSYPSSRRTSDLSREQYGANGQGRPDPLRSDPLRSDPLRSDPLRSDPLRSDPLRSDPVRSDPLGAGRVYGGTVPTAAYPYPQQPYGVPAQSMNTPPYGYGSPADSRAQAGPADDPRQANGGWIPGQVGGPGAGNEGRGSRPASPPANGYHGPYDPRGYDRRLIDLRE